MKISEQIVAKLKLAAVNQRLPHRYEPRQGARVHFIKFNSQFIPLIQAGTKTQTIRARDMIVFEEWEGKPYEKGKKVIRHGMAKILAVNQIVIHQGRMGIYDDVFIPYSDFYAEKLAKADGFYSVSALLDWFTKNHGARRMTRNCSPLGRPNGLSSG